MYNIVNFTSANDEQSEKKRNVIKMANKIIIVAFELSELVLMKQR